MRTRTTVAFLAWAMALGSPGLSAARGAASNLTQTTTTSVDVIPPLVTVTSPAEGLTTIADRVTLLGTVKDAGSGVHHVTCNGRKASLRNGSVRCVVRLLAGVNAVVLLAVDAAGNSASAGVRVLREMPAGTLTMFPDTLRIGTHEGFLELTTEAGTRPKDVRWSTSDPNIVTLHVDKDFVAFALVQPQRPGDAIVTAISGGRTATARVTVVDSEEPSEGTVRYSVVPIAGLKPQRPIVVGPSRQESPDVYLIDADRRGNSIVRGIYASHSNLVWRGAVPGVPRFADSSGGVIATIGPAGHERIIGRFDQLGGRPVWQFEVRGEIRDGAVAEDGTIYMVERVVEASSRSGRLTYDMIVAIDGLTGLAKARVPMPASTTTGTAGCGPAERKQQPSELGPLAAFDTGIHVMLLEAHDSRVSSCNNGRRVAGRGVVESSRTMRVVRITASGIENLHTLWSWKDAWPEASPHPRPIQDAVPGQVFINQGGELLAIWNRASAGPEGLATEVHVTRIAGSATTDVARDAGKAGRDSKFRVLLDAFDLPLLYLSDGSSIEAVDLASGKTKWTSQTPGAPFFASIHSQRFGVGPIAVNDPARGLLVRINDRGEVTRTTSAHIAEPRAIIQGNGYLHGIDPVSRAFVQIAFPDDNSSGWYARVDVDPSYEGVRGRLANLGVK